MSVLVIPEFENDDEQLLDNAEVAEQPFSDDRANVPVSETTERFLRAVLNKVPLDRIEELHLFSPLRQGTAETGIAVIAARVIVPDEPESDVLQHQLEAAPDVEVDEPEVEAFAADDSVIEEAPIDEPPITELAIEVDAAVADVVAADDSPYADEPLPVAEEDMLEFAHQLTPEVADELPYEPPVARVRHTVYTARYRLVIKGPDRGKWEMDVVDEADAPLVAIESVVRGVQRRAGEETGTIRYDAAQLARALRLTPTA